jgi:hypothetical protein
MGQFIQRRVFRGDPASVGDLIQLRAKFFSSTTGVPITLDTFPTISISEPSGNILLTSTSIGIYRVDVGVYGYDFIVPNNASNGVYVDVWNGLTGGYTPAQEYNFVVTNTDLPIVQTDGYCHLGDEPGFDFSQEALKNINRLIFQLKARLNSSGKSMSKDSYGNDILIDCDIFTTAQLTTFLITSLSQFNSIPYFTGFRFEDTEFFDIYSGIIVMRAAVEGMYAKALIERGREYQINDNGISVNIPNVSELLTTQASSLMATWETDCKMIKNSMRERPLGLGLMSISNGSSPQVKRLRVLRSRQIY